MTYICSQSFSVSHIRSRLVIDLAHHFVLINYELQSYTIFSMEIHVKIYSISPIRSRVEYLIPTGKILAILLHWNLI